MPKKILIYLAMMAGIIAFAALFILLFANSTEMSCVRPPGRAPVCTITKEFLGRFRLTSPTVFDVVDVKKERTCDDGCSYRAALVSSNGKTTPLNEVWTDEGPVLNQIAEVRSFLDGGQDTFERKEPVPWWVVALVGGMGAVGVVVLAINLAGALRKR